MFIVLRKRPCLGLSSWGESRCIEVYPSDGGSRYTEVSPLLMEGSGMLSLRGSRNAPSVNVP